MSWLQVAAPGVYFVAFASFVVGIVVFGSGYAAPRSFVVESVDSIMGSQTERLSRN